MPPILQEWLNLGLRWAHVVAAIMWIGDSFLFMWMDASLTRPAAGRAGTVTGELWMTHSGGFYEVLKHKSLASLPTACSGSSGRATRPGSAASCC
jgi:uncharacterized membrane protein